MTLGHDVSTINIITPIRSISPAVGPTALNDFNSIDVSVTYFQSELINRSSLQCFDAVGWAAGRASGL